MKDKIASNQINLQTAVFILLIIHICSFGMFGPAQGFYVGVWVSWLVSLLGFVPALLLWSHLVKKMPGMDLFAMLEHGFGRVLGRLFGLCYILFFLFLAASTRFFYAAMTQMLTLSFTPFVVILLLFFLLSAYLAKSGLQAMGKWCALLVAFAAVMTLLFFLLATPIMRLENILPLMPNGGEGVLRGAARFFALTIGNAVMMLALLGNFEAKASPKKLFFIATAIAILFFAFNFLRDTAILGQGGVEASVYPSYKAAGLIRLGGTGTRIEVFVLLFDVVAGLTKVALCIIAAARGFAHLFGQTEENAFVLSVVFLTVGLSATLFSNLHTLFSVAPTYLRVAPVFQVLIPLILAFVLLFRRKKSS